jgi:hypothetical protein
LGDRFCPGSWVGEQVAAVTPGLSPGDQTVGAASAKEEWQRSHGPLSPVTNDCPPSATAFTGTVKLIELESGDDSHDHLIDPAQFLHFIMAKQ